MPTSRKIEKLIDRFYVGPISRIMSKQVFRYLMCGMFNFFIYILCYAVTYHFIFAKRDLDLGFVVISSYVATLGIALPINFLVGFWLQRNISFKNSPLKGRTQFVRHMTIAVAGLIINYLFTKLFVEVCHIYPTVAQVIIYCITAVLTYLAQKFFTFRGAQKE